MSRTSEDDLGAVVELPDVVRRVVSLVPSLTESLEATVPGIVVGATDWCTHPAELSAERVGGTKNPKVDRIVALAPDVVIANEEENRAVDIEQLRAAGLAVWVTAPRTVADALTSLDRMLVGCCGLARPKWLDDAAAVWAPDGAEPGPRMSAAVPIWRRPWMFLGRDTFASDLLSRLDIDNALAFSAERYPKLDLAAVADEEPDVVLLPDEPYRFGWDDGPEAFVDWSVPIACVSGRHLTWYGPSLVEAREVLLDQIADARLP